MIIDTAEPMANSLRPTANGLGRSSFLRTSLLAAAARVRQRVPGATECGVGTRCTVRQEPQRSTLYESAEPTLRVETMMTADSLLPTAYS